MSAPIVFAVVLVVYVTGHHVGDYWVQTGPQAMGKALPGWTGRRFCAAHVATYTLTLATLLGLAWLTLGLPLNPGFVLAGLLVSAVTHYFADRRRPLFLLAARLGKREFWESGEGLASGAAHLDQSWHWLWLFAAALITAGGAR